MNPLAGPLPTHYDREPSPIFADLFGPLRREVGEA